MGRKQKDPREWTAADADYSLALAFLRGYEERDSSDARFKLLRSGSPEETQAREALVRVLRNYTFPLLKKAGLPFIEQVEPATSEQLLHLVAILQLLADLFDEPKTSIRPGLPDRTLVINARGSGRRPHFDRDWRVACFIYEEMAKDPQLKTEAAVAAAKGRYGGSRATNFRAWKKYKKDVAAVAKLEVRKLEDGRVQIRFGSDPAATGQ